MPDGVPFHRVGFANHRGLSNGTVGNEGAFYFCGPDIMAGNDDDIVGTTEHHDIPVPALYCKVTCCINPVDGLPVFTGTARRFYKRCENIAGQGALIARKPPGSGGTEFPSLSTTSAMTPGLLFPANPGRIGSPTMVVIICIPVSVCHQVSTIGLRSFPMAWWYHTNASGFRGSPTDPMIRRECRSYLFRPLLSHLHEHPDCSRRGIENIDLLLLDQFPPDARTG